MVVACVIQLPPAGQVLSDAIDALESRLQLLGAKYIRDCSLECELLSSAPILDNDRSLYVVQFSEYPASLFTCVDNNTALVSDNIFYLLIMKLREFYHKKLGLEGKGLVYEIADFTIRIVSITIPQSASVLGALVEIEYQPATVLKDCVGLLKEFLHNLGLSGDSVPMACTKPDSIYKVEDTILQYVDHFNRLQKTA